MRRQDMENLRIVELEIASLRRQIQRLEEERSYISAFIVDGLPKAKTRDDGMAKTLLYLERSQRLKEKLVEKLGDCMADEERAYDMLDAVRDAELRQIIFLRCLEAKTWREVGEQLGMERTTAAKKYAKFWLENECFPHFPPKVC